MVNAFSTPAAASQSAKASSASDCSKVLRAGAWQPLKACSNNCFMQSSLLAIFGLVAEAEAEPLQAEQVFTQLEAARLAAEPGLCNFVHQAGGEGAEGDEFFAVQRFDLIDPADAAPCLARTVLRRAGQQASRFQKPSSVKRISRCIYDSTG